MANVAGEAAHERNLSELYMLRGEGSLRTLPYTGRANTTAHLSAWRKQKQTRHERAQNLEQQVTAGDETLPELTHQERCHHTIADCRDTVGIIERHSREIAFSQAQK